MDAPDSVASGEDTVDAIATAISLASASDGALAKKERQAAKKAGASPPVQGTHAGAAVEADRQTDEEEPQEFFS